MALALSLFVLPWSGETPTGDPGPKAFDSAAWAWGGCVLGIAATTLSLLSAWSATSVARWSKGIALLFGAVGLASVFVQAITEADRSAGLYVALVASMLVVTVAVIDWLGWRPPPIPRWLRVVIWAIVGVAAAIGIGVAIWAYGYWRAWSE